MALDNSWELNESGNVKFAALMGYSMAIMPEGGLVRLEYAETVTDIDQGTLTGLQLQFSASQAREVGEALRRLAETLESQDNREQPQVPA